MADTTTPITPDEAVQILRALQARIQAPDDSRVAHAKSFTLANVGPHCLKLAGGAERVEQQRCVAAVRLHR